MRSGTHGLCGRDRDVDRRPVTDRLAALRPPRRRRRRRPGRSASGRRRSRGPRARRAAAGSRARVAHCADGRRAAAQDGDVEGVDADLHELLGLVAGGRGGAGALSSSSGGSVSRTRRWSVQSPPFSTLDGTPGEWRQRPERAAAAGELEGGDVVLLAVVVGGQRRRLQQVDRAVRARSGHRRREPGPPAGPMARTARPESRTPGRDPLDRTGHRRSPAWPTGCGPVLLPLRLRGARSCSRAGPRPGPGRD